MSHSTSSENLPSAQILASSARTAAKTAAILQGAGLPCQIHRNFDDLLSACEGTPGVLMLAAKPLDPSTVQKLSKKLAYQPHWSDVPIIVTIPEFGLSTDHERQMLEALPNLTILQEPVPPLTLVSVMRNSLAARQKQFEIRDLLIRERSVRRSAEQSSRLKDEFLATLSHELRTPLNAIVGYAELLPLEAPHTPGFFEAIEQIARNARVQSQLINDILDISKIITGKLELRVEPVRLKDLVHEVIISFRCAAKAKSLRLHADLGDDNALLMADPARMRQIIWNLLSNAIKFTPEHGHIWVSLHEEGSHITLSLKDSGKGIESAFLPYVFDLFRQQEGGFNRSFGGLGLGLSIVRHLVEAHGGEVRAESQGRGLGASFSIVLPTVQHDTSNSFAYDSHSQAEESSPNFPLS